MRYKIKIDELKSATVEHKKIKVIFRLKCNMGNHTLGHHIAKWVYIGDDRTRAKITTNYVTVFLPKLWRQFVCYNDNNYSFDEIFSEVISHELLHEILLRVDGVAACGGLDKLNGQKYIFRDADRIGAGLPLDRNNGKMTELHESNIN
jgi:hypothetical protein